MAENRLTVVRHGETEWSRDGKHTGRTDIPLTDNGRAVAAKLSQALGGQTYALVLTSPMARARDTAAIAGFPDAIVDATTFESGTTATTKGAPRPRSADSDDADWFLWDDGVPNGETLADVAARADRVIEPRPLRSTATCSRSRTDTSYASSRPAGSTSIPGSDATSCCRPRPCRSSPGNVTLRPSKPGTLRSPDPRSVREWCRHHLSA